MNEQTKKVFQNIVKQSISNVLCIDEKYIEPYADEAEVANKIFSKSVYDAFATELKCKTVIYPYKQDDNQWKDYLDKQDLLVIDWQLTDPFYPQKTLDIIDEAIASSIPYVCVYTSFTGDELIQVVNLFKAYYSGYSEKEIEKSARNALSVGINEESVNNIVTHFITTSAQAKEFKTELNNSGADLGESTKEIFNHCDCNEWNKLYCYYNSKTPNYSKDHKLFFEDKENTNSIIVDETYVFFVSKETENDIYKPQGIIEIISEELTSTPRSVFNLLWIYYFNLIKAAIYKKNKLPLKIPADALKYFAKSTIEDSGEAHFFSTVLWMVIDEIVEYITKSESSIPEKEVLIEIQNQGKELTYEKACKDLLKLNAILNMNHELSEHDHKIILGDIFLIEHESKSDNEETIAEGNKKEPEDDYYLCVSALCDCAQPKVFKEYYSYNFIRGKRSTKQSCGKNPEDGFLSFVQDGEETYFINWNNQIFGGYINTEANTVNKDTPFEIVFENKPYKFTYICNIKETYAQRLANNSFSNGLRVGTTFAKKCISE